MKYIEIREPGTPEVLQLAEREPPQCRDGEVKIKVAAAGVNRPDVIQRMGLYPPPPDASDIPGLEVAGTVCEVSDDVGQWQVGDRVCALTNGGGYAEYVTAPSGQCLPLPKGWTFMEAAGLPETCFTVWGNVFDRGRLQAGETLLVHGGSSGIGVTAIQMAVAMGASVYATAGSEEKCRACVALGAAQAVNYRTEDFVEQLLGATGRKGFDVILDMVGGDYIGKNFRLAAMEGRIVAIAFQKGFEATVNFAPLMLKRLVFTGSTLRPQSASAKAAIARALLANIWPLIEAGKFKPVIAQTFPLDQAASAHQLMESGQHIGKIILELR